METRRTSDSVSTLLTKDTSVQDCSNILVLDPSIKKTWADSVHYNDGVVANCSHIRNKGIQNGVVQLGAISSLASILIHEHQAHRRKIRIGRNRRSSRCTCTNVAQINSTTATATSATTLGGAGAGISVGIVQNPPNHGSVCDGTRADGLERSHQVRKGTLARASCIGKMALVDIILTLNTEGSVRAVKGWSGVTTKERDGSGLVERETTATIVVVLE